MLLENILANSNFANVKQLRQQLLKMPCSVGKNQELKNYKN